MVIYYWLCSLLDPVLHNKLWDFQNMALRKMFRPVRKEMREDWKKMRSEELHIMNSSPNIIISFGLMIQIIRSETITSDRYVANMRGKRNAHTFLVGQSEGRRQQERPGYRRKDNSKTGSKK